MRVYFIGCCHRPGDGVYRAATSGDLCNMGDPKQVDNWKWTEDQGTMNGFKGRR